MTLAVYKGHEPRMFLDYLDLDTGHVLEAEPGGTYDMAPASGRLVPDVPEQWFTAVVPAEGEGALAEGDSAPPEPGEPATGEDPETDQPQQF